MREIKFRVWDHSYQEMVNSVSIIHCDLLNKTDVRYYVGKKYVLKGAYSVDIELMQHTGLKDKNGTDIYEGDIVRSNHFIGYKGEQQFLYHVIKWSGKHIAYFALNADTMNESDGSTLLFSYFRNALDVTVVGNIYENHELLGV